MNKIKCPCPSADSICLMAEAASLPTPSQEVATALSQDVSYRLRLIISRAAKFMRHANRDRLTCADINKALRWSDCQPVYGYECNANQRARYSYATESQVFQYEETAIDLVERCKVHPKAEALLTDDIKHESLPSLKIEKLS